MATAVGLLILVIAIAMVVPDLKAAATPAKKSAPRPSPYPVNAGANDPSVTDLSARIAAGVAQGLTAALAGGVIGGEQGLVKGAAAQERLPSSTLQDAVTTSQRAASGAGATTGAQASGPGAGIGAAPLSFLGGIGEGFRQSVVAGHENYGWNDARDIPLIGAAYTASDAVTGWLGGLVQRGRG